ncbi:MAG: DUF4142 domain-containing protein [Rhodoblastus sp.]
MKLAMIAAAVLLATPALAQTQAASSQDFLKDAIQGDNAEVQMGRLAAARGGSKEVRDYGKMLAADHQKAGAEARKLAGQMKIKAPGGIPAEAKDAKAKLQKLRGADFDKEFVGVMVEDHQKDIARYDEQANGGDNDKVKALAAKTLPTLKKHLEAAQKLPGAAQ